MIQFDSSHCPATDKQRFASMSDANRVIRHFKRRSRRTTIPRRVYFCRACSGWHLTSQTKDGPEDDKL